jgi:tetratricopeptide (TPR) repeat protein
MSILGRMFSFAHNETYTRAIRCYDQGQYEEAIEEFAQILEHEAAADAVTLKLARFYTAEAHTQLGSDAMKRRDWDQCAYAYGQALTLQPQYADLHFHRANALWRLKRFDEALFHLLRAVDINKKFVKAIIYHGIVLYETGNRDAGLQRVQEAINIKPELNACGRFTRAMEYHDKGDFLNVLGALETIASTEADDVLFHANLADDLYRCQSYDEAIEEYRKAISINPRYADVRNHCGMAYQMLGQYEDAVAEFKAAISINSKYVEAYVNLGNTYRDMGDSALAREFLDKALEIDPNNPFARNSIAAA